MTAARQPKGTSTGGQFAASAHDEAESSLTAPSYREEENESQRRVREALAPISQWYPNAHSVHLAAPTDDPWGDDEDWYDNGETIYGFVRIDGILDKDGVYIWDGVLSRRDPRLERIEDTFSGITRYSDLPEDSSYGSSRGGGVGVDL